MEKKYEPGDRVMVNNRGKAIILAVIGKGHETTLERGGRTLPFCEREIIEAYMEQKKARSQ